MKQTELKALLERVAAGDLDVNSAMQELRQVTDQDLGSVRRGVRPGMTEVVNGAVKTAQQIAGIAETLLSVGQEAVLITRLDPEKAAAVQQSVPLLYFEMGRIGVAGKMPAHTGKGTVLVATGGVGDMPVAEEAAITAEALGNEVVRLYDVGVSDLRRLLRHMDEITSARAVIAIAGTDGALASVIGGLAGCPVIAVPTSTGGGASFGGISALLGMLNSCANGVSVVNIDNGFGAGYLASQINHLE